MKVNVVHILPFDLYMFILDIDFFYSKCLYSKNPLIYYNSYKLIFKKKDYMRYYAFLIPKIKVL